MVSYIIDRMDKKRCCWLCGLLWVLVLFTGCQKAPINDKIEGHWRLERFTTLKDNQVTECSRLFYGITYMVTEVSEKQGEHHYGAFVARTVIGENGNSLTLKDFRVRHSTSDNGEQATVEQLLPFGINNPKETFFLVKESSRHYMVLESDYARLELKKF